MSDPVDRARAEAIHAANSTTRRAESLERDLDRIEAMLQRADIGRLIAVASTLAEHETRITKLEARHAD